MGQSRRYNKRGDMDTRVQYRHLMKTRQNMTRVFMMVMLLIGNTAVAQVNADEAKQLEQRYRGMPLRVRDLLSDSKIRYDAHEKLLGKWHPGQWTCHSNVEVTSVEAK